MSRIASSIVLALTLAATLAAPGCESSYVPHPGDSYPSHRVTSAAPAARRSVAVAPAPAPAPMPVKAEPAPAPAPAPAPMRAIAAPAPAADSLSRAVLAFPTGDRATSVLLVEKVGPSQVQCGQAFSYDIDVTNLSNTALENVVLFEQLPSNFAYVKAIPSPSTTSGAELRWAMGALQPMSTRSFKIHGSAKAAGAMTHTAKVAFETPPLSITIVAIEPKLALAKAAPAEAMLDEAIPVKYAVSNEGTGLARNVKITENLPDGLLTADNKSAVSLDAGSLDRGDAREFNVALKAVKPGRYTSTATASADGGLTAQATTTTTVRQAQLTLAKTSPAKSYVGSKVAYQITVTNKGDGQARGVVVTDTIPAGAKFESATDGGALTGDAIVWNIGALAPGQSKTVTATLRAVDISKITNTATATANGADTVTATATTDQIGIPGILLNVVDTEDPVMVGQQTTYIIEAQNQGSADGTNIRIRCELEPNAEYVSSTGPTQGKLEGNVLTFTPLARLGQREKATWRVTVKAVKAGDVRFKTYMESDQLTRPAYKAEASNFYN